MSNTKIIFATKNKNKIKEIKEIMKDTNFEIISIQEANIDIDIEETGTTFEQNAIIKAKAVMKATSLVALADDSGLEIDYLNKAPGVYSARYLGENTPYNVKNNHILELLKDVPKQQRTARFVCAVAAVFPNDTSITTKGIIEGIIGYEQIGENGFGYDPIFFVPEYNMTTAQMSMEQKNSISHRGKALMLMKNKLLAMR